MRDRISAHDETNPLRPCENHKKRQRALLRSIAEDGEMCQTNCKNGSQKFYFLFRKCVYNRKIAPGAPPEAVSRSKVSFYRHDKESLLGPTVRSITFFRRSSMHRRSLAAITELSRRNSRSIPFRNAIENRFVHGVGWRQPAKRTSRNTCLKIICFQVIRRVRQDFDRDFFKAGLTYDSLANPNFFLKSATSEIFTRDNSYWKSCPSLEESGGAFPWTYSSRLSSSKRRNRVLIIGKENKAASLI